MQSTCALAQHLAVDAANSSPLYVYTSTSGFGLGGVNTVKAIIIYNEVLILTS